ncbi:MAG: hypothetical protein AAGF04_01850 [Chlamydiota bacterium]
MEFSDLENAFNRSMHFAFCRSKILFTFPFLLLCAAIFAFCRAICLHADPWIALSMLFAPFLLSSGVFLSLGILLMRMYYHDVKRLPYTIRKMLTLSFDVLVASAYFSVPLFLGYVFLSMVLGIFMALRLLPYLGAEMGALFAFGPFFLILSSLLLCLGNFIFLFWGTPIFALHTGKQKERGLLVLRAFSQKTFRLLAFFFIGSLPIFLVGLLLGGAAQLTSLSYLRDLDGIWLVVSWFLISLPVAWILSPFVIFFFHFAAESHQLITRQTEL